MSDSTVSRIVDNLTKSPLIRTVGIESHPLCLVTSITGEKRNDVITRSQEPIYKQMLSQLGYALDGRLHLTLGDKDMEAYLTNGDHSEIADHFLVVDEDENPVNPVSTGFLRLDGFAIASMETNFTRLTRGISSLDTEVANLSGQVDSLSLQKGTDISNLSAHISSHSTQIDSHSTQIDSHSTQIDSLSTQIDSHSTQIDSLSSGSTSTIVTPSVALISP